MTMRDRLAADLHSAICDYHRPDLLTCGVDHADDADRLIALGWVRLDEEALARALHGRYGCRAACRAWGPDEHGVDMSYLMDATAIIRALREEP
jgi:hypothetical protein